MTNAMSLMELHTTAIAAGGGCVARADDGRVVFVRHALPGEKVLAHVTGETTSFLRADAVEIVEPSPDRVVPPCPHAGPGRCGGCDFQHVALPTQRELKASLVSEQLRRLAGDERPVVVEEVPGAPDGLGWRTRVRFAVDRNGRVGLHKHRSHDIERLEHCLIASAAVEAVGVGAHRWSGARELEVMTSPGGGKPVVSVETGRRRLGDRPAVNAGRVVNGRAEREPHRLNFEVLGRGYQVSAGVFWQVHPGAPEVLARSVLDGLQPQVGEKVADLYAGAGLFTALLAEAVGPTGRVVAIERSGRACADAARNTDDQPQVAITRADVTAELLASARLGGPNLVVLDPAREGAGRGVMAALAGLAPRPRRIAYVSCDPASFARDLRVMTDAGWTMASLRCFDLFPMTEHVELVAMLDAA
ncbi:MAG TPA: TRAM domain-containing protein [Acidimicrobiales bacterium]|jgi:tRNA/tmRNA/rRNA uracil-C5-methylase (TrmA/RlmC/RlmD family)|nr:TRAM domain-containing protein [Acidimicrobiales bacterium]